MTHKDCMLVSSAPRYVCRNGDRDIQVVGHTTGK
jgi:hypothetical protein